MRRFDRAPFYRTRDLALEGADNRSSRGAFKGAQAVFKALDAGCQTIARREVLGGVTSRGFPAMGVIAWPGELRDKEGAVQIARRAYGRLIAMAPGARPWEMLFGPGKPSDLFARMVAEASGMGWGISRQHAPDDEVHGDPYRSAFFGVPQNETESVPEAGDLGPLADESEEDDEMARQTNAEFEVHLRRVMAGHVGREKAISVGDLARHLSCSTPKVLFHVAGCRARIKGFMSGHAGYWIEPELESRDRRESGPRLPHPAPADAAPPKVPAAAGRGATFGMPTIDEARAQDAAERGLCRVIVTGLALPFDQPVSRVIAQAVVRLAYGLDALALTSGEAPRG